MSVTVMEIWEYLMIKLFKVGPQEGPGFGPLIDYGTDLCGVCMLLII